MNYVVVDFEWNQSMIKGASESRMPFEIIEIGAVKLDASLQICDSYSQFIKPGVYKKLHYKTKELTGISEEMLKTGISFAEAALDFLLWCGDNFMFVTWGNTDMTEFQRNLSYYRVLDLLPGPFHYINAQKIFRLFYSDIQTNSALDVAAAYFDISNLGDFHRALADARYTVAVFAAMDRQKCLDNFTMDYYQYPQNKKEEIHLTYENYYKYISRGYATKEAAFENREVRSTRCYVCGCPAPKKIRWFVSKTKNYYCLALCLEHGWIRGKIKFKRMDDGRYIAVKTLRIVDEVTAQNIRQIKKDVLEKRREKRHKGNEE